MILSLLPLPFSITTLARIVMEPLPVMYASRMPARPMIRPAVGKSGPSMTCIRSFTVASGSSRSIIAPSITSHRLCGGMLVAMATAIPVTPLTSRFGNLAGKTTGSCSLSSKLGLKSTAFLPISTTISLAIADIRASVYRIAPGGSLSIEPKFPCPSTNGYRKEKSCAIRTSAK